MAKSMIGNLISYYDIALEGSGKCFRQLDINKEFYKLDREEAIRRTDDKAYCRALEIIKEIKDIEPELEEGIRNGKIKPRLAYLPGYECGMSYHIIDLKERAAGKDGHYDFRHSRVYINRKFNNILDIDYMIRNQENPNSHNVSFGACSKITSFSKVENCHYFNIPGIESPYEGLDAIAKDCINDINNSCVEHYYQLTSHEEMDFEVFLFGVIVYELPPLGDKYPAFIAINCFDMDRYLYRPYESRDSKYYQGGKRKEKNDNLAKRNKNEKKDLQTTQTLGNVLFYGGYVILGLFAAITLFSKVFSSTNILMALIVALIFFGILFGGLFALSKFYKITSKSFVEEKMDEYMDNKVKVLLPYIIADIIILIGSIIALLVVK